MPDADANAKGADVSKNIYDEPAAFGLTLLGEASEGSGYDYNILAVWQDPDGRLWWLDDAGCSCSSPFEDYDRTNLHRLTSIDELNAAIAETFKYSAPSDAEEIPKLRRLVRDALEAVAKL